MRRGLVTTLKAVTESFINSAIGWQQISYIFGVIYIAFPLIRPQLLRSPSCSLSHTPSLIELNFPFLSCTQLHMCDNCELPLPQSLSLPSAAAAVKCFTHTQCSHSCFSLSAHSASLSLACMLRRSLKPLSLPKCLALSCSLSARALSSTLALSLSVDDLLIFAHFLHFYGFLHYFYTSYFVVVLVVSIVVVSVVVSVLVAFIVVVLGAYVYGLWFFFFFLLFFWSTNLVVFQLLHSSLSSSSSHPLPLPFLTNCLHWPSRFRFYFCAIRKCERTARAAKFSHFQAKLGLFVFY